MSPKKSRRYQQKLYQITYDKPGLNRQAYLIKKSLDEVKKLLEGKDRSKSSHS